jgi:MoaA/NifB/PqqE/SkfB family radical SAM enzyme
MKPGKLKLASRYLVHRFSKVHLFEVQACLTNECNRKCEYCACPTLPKDDLSTAEWRDLIRGLRRRGTMRLKLQGGEPTLRADFGELAALAQDLGMITAVATNGSIIPGRPELLEHLDEIIVSLNSLKKEVQDDLRGEGSFEAIRTTIDLAQARGVKVFNNMVVNKKNFAELENVLDFCENLGITFHAQAVVFGRAFFDDGARDIQLSQEETQDLHDRLAGWKEGGRAILFSRSTYAAAARWPDYNELNKPGSRPSSCFAGHDYVHIEPNGDIYPCNLHIGTFRPKNAVRDGLVPALLHAQKHQCADCWHPYFNERKSLFRFRFETVKSVFRS